jgi:hypothetical protein
MTFSLENHLDEHSFAHIGTNVLRLTADRVIKVNIFLTGLTALVAGS